MWNLLSPEAESYVLKHSSHPSEVCEKIYRETKEKHPSAVMLVGPLEGNLLAQMVRLSGAKRILEFGTFTGYSALCMAEQLPADGKLTTMDISVETTDWAKANWKLSPHGHKIECLLGPALETVSKLKGPFDLVFIDADKPNYLHYFLKSLELLSPKGMIIVDNCLWDGKVLAKPIAGDADTQAIQELNDFIERKADLLKVLLPIRDGVFLVQRNSTSA